MQNESSKMAEQHFLKSIARSAEAFSEACLRFTLRKYTKGDTDKRCAEGDAPDEELDLGGNVLTTVGANILWQKVIGGAGTVYSNANAYTGVGDGNGSVPTGLAADTDLTAPTNLLLVGMDSTYPTITTNAITFSSTFSTAQANFHWREWGIFNGSNHANSTMLNHKGVDLGTKVNTATWQLQTTLSLT